ncbi:MAG TPA: hypothetical protein VGP07_13325 [Polyangia bacterium]|jgi:hypothetical protein
MKTQRRKWRIAGAFAVILGVAGIGLFVFQGCGASSGTDAFGTGGNSDGGIGGSGAGGNSGSGGTSAGSGGSSSSGSGGRQGSGGTSAGSGGSTATGGRGGTSGAGGATGSGGTSAGCSVIIQPVTPSSLDGIEAGAGVTVRVRGIVIGASVNPPSWTWTITFAVGGTVVDVVPSLYDSDTVAEFPVSMSGSYRIAASVDDPRCLPVVAVANATVPQGAAFTFRTTAPGLPVQESKVKLVDGSYGNFALDPGQTFAIKPRKAGQSNLMTAYVRISSPANSFVIEGETSRTPIMTVLRPQQTYDLLVVPSDPYAPLLLPSSFPASWATVDIDQGTPVTAQMLTSDGAPVPDARLILKSGILPSTIGVSDSGGSMTLWTRPGTMSATVVPPDGTGLPQANITATDAAGVTLAMGGASLSLTMTWADLTTATPALTVKSIDGATPVANAHVRLALHTPIANAGTLVVSAPGFGDTVLGATGSVNEDIVTDASGLAAFPPVPAGAYDVTIIPPAGSAPAAVTTTTLTLSNGNPARSINLVQKVPLTGTLLTGTGSKSAVQGAVVNAIDVGTGATGMVASAISDGNGAFTLSVDPGRTYQLTVLPIAGPTLLGRTVFPAMTVGSSGGSTGPITLPAGVPYAGSITTNGNPVAGAFVQVFCVSPIASCVDPSVSLAEATTLGDGTFSLILPQLVTN